MYYACDYDQVSLWACKLEKANAQEFVREPISNLQHWFRGLLQSKDEKNHRMDTGERKSKPNRKVNLNGGFVNCFG